MTRNSQNSRPAETDPYMQYTSKSVAVYLHSAPASVLEVRAADLSNVSKQQGGGALLPAAAFWAACAAAELPIYNYQLPNVHLWACHIMYWRPYLPVSRNMLFVARATYLTFLELSQNLHLLQKLLLLEHKYALLLPDMFSWDHTHRSRLGRLIYIW